jgi:hypothetical protein
VLKHLKSHFGLALVLLAAAATPLEAAFIGGYVPSNFTLVNVNADGLATLQGNGSLLVLGGNNGSGDPGTTDFLIAALETGIVQFNFFYDAQDVPGFDFAGYIIGSSFTQIADTVGQSGFISFNVIIGQIFGFRVATLDNTGEPGQLTISNFSAPGGGTEVPEPSTWLSGLAGLTAVIWRARHSRAVRHGN